MAAIQAPVCTPRFTRSPPSPYTPSTRANLGRYATPIAAAFAAGQRGDPSFVSGGTAWSSMCGPGHRVTKSNH